MTRPRTLLRRFHRAWHHLWHAHPLIETPAGCWHCRDIDGRRRLGGGAW